MGFDPLIFDVGGGSLDSANFTEVSNALDFNNDGLLDTVYMPNASTGLLVYLDIILSKLC